MTTNTIEAIRRGGELLARQPGKIRELEQANAELKAYLAEAVASSKYWQQKYDQAINECNRFQQAYKITRRRLQRKRKLNNSQPSSKTIAQALADHDLQQRGL